MKPLPEHDCDVWPMNLTVSRALELADAHAEHTLFDCTVRTASPLLLFTGHPRIPAQAPASLNHRPPPMTTAPDAPMDPARQAAKPNQAPRMCSVCQLAATPNHLGPSRLPLGDDLYAIASSVRGKEVNAPARSNAGSVVRALAERLHDEHQVL